MSDTFDIFNFPDLKVIEHKSAEVDVARPDGTIDTETVEYFLAVPRYPNNIVCPSCGLGTHKESKGVYERDIQDLPMFGHKTIIHIKTQRFICKNCNKYFVPSFEIAEDGDSLSRRLKEAIRNDAYKKVSFAHVASTYAVDKKTVRREFNKRMDIYEEILHYPYVKHLSVDEAHLANEARLVLLSADTSPTKIIDICPVGIKKEPFIEALYKFENYKDIETVTTDMNSGYIAALDFVYPDRPRGLPDPKSKKKVEGPRVIIDRFHVTAIVLRAVEEARSILYKRLKQSIVDAYPDKTEREKAWKRVTNYKMSTYWFKKNIHEYSESMQRKILTFCKKYPDFETLMKIRTDFYKFYEFSKDYEEAERKLAEWLGSIPVEDPAYEGFDEVFTMFSRHLEDILHYFLDPPKERYSNGAIESRNRLIKLYKRMATAGKFETIRAKILYGETRIATYTTLGKVRKAPKGIFTECLSLYLGGVRSPEINATFRTILERSFAEDHMMYNPDCSLEDAILHVQSNDIIDDDFIASIFTNDNIHVKLYDAAAQLDYEADPSVPVIIPMPINQFIREATELFETDLALGLDGDYIDEDVEDNPLLERLLEIGRQDIRWPDTYYL